MRKIKVYRNGRLMGHIIEDMFIPFVSGGDFWSGTVMPVIDPLDISGVRKKSAAESALRGGYNQARGDITSLYDTARPELTTGMEQAQQTTRTGFQTARNATQTGYEKAAQDYAAGGKSAVDTARQGYGAAQAQYETAPMVASRQELYNRVLGKGGYSPEVLANLEAKTREEFGAGARSAEQGLNQFYGDASARGLAGENLARAQADLAAKRAQAVRDIETGSAQLARQEQTGAITSLGQEAAARAGLSAQEANTVSTLQEKIAAGGAGLTTAETNALAQLAAQEGTTVSDLQARLASGQAALTTEEAKALAELAVGKGTAEATVATTKTGPLGLW
jgi:hypothetical protein